MSALKRIFVGKPISSADAEHQRIGKVVALAVFSSDAISSTAYASQEILLVVAFTGSSLSLGLAKLVPIAIVVALLLSVVVASYRQTIFAYPSGGGSYVVSRENLGNRPSMVAGASLLVDYILTVAVSICAGVRAITSINHDLTDYRVELCVALILLITVANLRGLKESGSVFAIPTYLYIAMLTALVGYGLFRAYHLFGLDISPILPKGASEAEIMNHPVVRTLDAEDKKHVIDALVGAGASLGLFKLLHGFSSGAVALTGVEAISNGVPAFRKPEPKNAAATMTWMAVILGSLFFFVSLLASRLRPIPNHSGESVFSQMGAAVFGRGVVYLVFQIATASILVLAANTAYADFPRLSSIIAKDGYLPRQFMNRGDRLVFSNGILLLAGAAIALVVIFQGEESALIPLYAVGVFTSFTLSQTGMVRHHLRLREPKWQRGVVINAVGAVSTFVVLLIVAITKFVDGAWVSIVVVGIFYAIFRVISGHYQNVAKALKVTSDYVPRKMNHTVIVLVGTLHRGALEGIAYAKSLHPNHLAAVTVVSDEDEQHAIESAWLAKGIDIPLEIVHSPYRELSRPVLAYVDELDARWDNDIITVVIPEFVVPGVFGKLLHNQSALLLKGRLLFRKGTVVTSVPYHLDTE